MTTASPWPTPMHIAHRERALRVAEPERDGAVDVLRRRDRLLCDVAADVDDRGHDALRDEARAVADRRDGHTVVREECMRCIADLGSGYRRGHQRAAPGEEEGVETDGTRGVELCGDSGVRRVLADRQHEAQGARRWPFAVFELGAERMQ